MLRFNLLTFCLLVSFVVGPRAATVIAANSRPNIVVILCDDLGYGDLECYGHPHIKTPHLNQLAESGIRFTSCYSAAPVCSPSRVGLLTGRSPNRAGVYDWIPPANSPKPDARDQVHMRTEEFTIAKMLKNAGYATCMAGKWHCNSKFNSTAQPQPGDAGFEHWFGTQNNAAPSHENPNNYVRNGIEAGPLQGFSCQLATDEAVDWISSHHASQSETPFFLYLAFHEPHEPIASPKELVDSYEPVSANRDEAQFFANVANVDHAVGKLVKKLDELNLRDNTLIVFTSDNGPETLKRYSRAFRSYGRPTPLRGMKLWTTEAGFRVAGIMNWPATIKSAQTGDNPQVVSSLDFLPTFAKLAKAKLPEEVELDGTDISPVFSGQEILRPKPLVWAYYNAINERRVAMRHGSWKVLAKLGNGSLPKTVNVFDGNRDQIFSSKLTDFEFYNVDKDISEEMAIAESEITEKLENLLRKEYEQLKSDSHVWTRNQD